MASFEATPEEVVDVTVRYIVAILDRAFIVTLRIEWNYSWYSNVKFNRSYMNINCNLEGETRLVPFNMMYPAQREALRRAGLLR